jgi:prepilin-type N-terminal cleavage/methylation domain-containing protein
MLSLKRTRAQKKKAFTLVELLVSLGVLGLIATLTLPQFYLSTDKIKKKAVLKQAYETLQRAVSLAYEDGVIESEEVIKYINGKKVCMVSGVAEGCISHSVSYGGHWDPTEGEEAAVVLPSGAVLSGFKGPIAIEGYPGLDTITIGLENGFATPEYYFAQWNLSDEVWSRPFSDIGDGTVTLPRQPGQIVPVGNATRDMLS